MKKYLIVIVVLPFIIYTSGCVPTSLKARDDLALKQDTERIMLMPVDIELSVLTAGGVLEPNAEWTETAKRLVHKAISEKMAERNLRIITEKDFADLTLDRSEAELQRQLIKLHETVGRSILLHKYVDILKLPSKEGKFDWTLGKEATFLKERFGADYALFVYLRDSYSSGGRVALMFVAAAAGISVPGGSQIGFASLVDLDSGQVVWFNRLFRTVGDLRNEVDADVSVDVLLSDFPMGG